MKLALERDWTLGERIGAGGFGAVFEAYASDGQRAAVKLVPKEPGAERELLFTDLVGVRNIVPVIDRGEHQGHWALVMPRAETSLRAHLAKRGRLPAGEAVAILSDVAETLADLDSRVVHRDIKPDNILLLDGRWCLADFGMARDADATTARHTFKFAGTFAYMAPERWKNQRATSAGDIYALGIVAHELLSGELPFKGPSENDFYEQHLHGTPPVLADAPVLLAALITECLYRAPQSRPVPGNVLARLHRIPATPLGGGLAALADANRSAVTRRAEADRQASRQATEAERRADLYEAATTSFAFIAGEFIRALTTAAPSAAVGVHQGGGWGIRLNEARLTLSGPSRVPAESLRTGLAPPPFDAVASVVIAVRGPANRQGYQGRSHSLWYADAQREGRYQWFETAFTDSPQPAAPETALDPFALDAQYEAGMALGGTLADHRVAWPFLPLALEDLDEFTGRWAGWLAQAAGAGLDHPGPMPSRDPRGSWR
ncbi:serine/threonine-protein kinase [Streptomyces sp. NPDC049040]|uniref:serine/threonine-protein kinase n=1 Tax=Streptomyces sp. NPDC049040 TaxID=3365593 RepID=UPI00371F80EE